jgi:hypothetical protein
MYGRYKNSWKQLSDARLECRAKEFIRIELELALTFIKVAHTKYSVGNVAGGDFSRNNAEKAYHEALNYFGKLSDFTSLERWQINGPCQSGQGCNCDAPATNNTLIGHYLFVRSIALCRLSTTLRAGLSRE